jgi:hypothetical protein
MLGSWSHHSLDAYALSHQIRRKRTRIRAA